MEFNKDINETITTLISEDKNSSLGDIYKQIDFQQKIIQEKLHNLIFSNYKTFLEASDNSEIIKSDLNEIKQLTQPLSELFPSFQKLYDTFLQKGQEIYTSQKQAKLALLKYPKLLEILEIPQLIDICIKNSHYESALTLSDFVNKTQSLFPDIEIIKILQNDVQKNMNLMLQALINKLKNDSQLPTTIMTIGMIRRMNVFSEDELRAIFLQCRSLWLRKEIRLALNKWISQSNANEQTSQNFYFALSKVIECYRVHLFDTVTQYNGMFSTSYEKPKNFDVQIGEDPNACILAGDHYKHILDSWLIFELTGLFDLISGLMERIEDLGGVLKSLSDQFAYLGSSLSRVRADIKPLLDQKLVFYMEKSLDKLFSDIPTKFGCNLEKYGASSSSKHPLTSEEAENYDFTSTARKHLSRFPVLLSTHNDFAKIYNSLDADCGRPIALYPFCLDATRRVIKACAHALNQYVSKENARLNVKEKGDLLGELSKAFIEQLVPTIFRYLESLFPQTALEQALGISALNPCPMIPGVEENVKKVLADLPHTVKVL